VPFDFDASEKPIVPRYFLTAMPHKQRLPRVRLLWDWLAAEAEQAEREIAAPE
jgi:hypothetical protein